VPATSLALAGLKDTRPVRYRRAANAPIIPRWMEFLSRLHIEAAVEPLHCQWTSGEDGRVNCLCPRGDPILPRVFVDNESGQIDFIKGMGEPLPQILVDRVANSVATSAPQQVAYREVALGQEGRHIDYTYKKQVQRRAAPGQFPGFTAPLSSEYSA